MCSPLKGILLIVPLKATIDSQRFRFWLCGVQFDSTVCITPGSQNYFENVRFRIFEFVTSFIYALTKNVWRKKYSLIFFDFQYNFHCNILRHHREITIIKYRIKTDSWQVFLDTFFHDSAVCITPRCFLKIRISRRNRNQIRKYFTLFIRGPDGFESWEKMEAENLVTHSL